MQPAGLPEISTIDSDVNCAAAVEPNISQDLDCSLIDSMAIQWADWTRSSGASTWISAAASSFNSTTVIRIKYHRQKVLRQQFQRRQQ